MRTRALIVATSLIWIAHTALADLPRRSLSGPPRIARGVVERFLIFRKQLLIAEGAGILHGIAALQGGVLVPVSEDRDGIYYQNLNGVWVFDNHYFTTLRPLPGIWYRGGLYFSKVKEDEVYAYIGNARKQDAYLERDSRQVVASALAQLRIGHVAKGARNSTRQQ
jgi:hypothetical protein